MSKKPDGRKAKRNDEENKNKKATPPRAQKPKKVKVPGLKPDFTPNLKRQAVRSGQELLSRISVGREKFPFFCDGVAGTYLIGYVLDDLPVAEVFTVKIRELPTIDDLPASSMLVIENTDGVYIPHKWIYYPAESARYAAGVIGTLQRQMLQFLQDVLYSEIRHAKHRWWMRQQQTQAAGEQEEITAEQPAAETAQKPEAKIICIQDSIWRRDCRPVEHLVKEDCFGLYDLSDEKGLLIAELRSGKSGNEFVVKKVDNLHHLSSLLLEGVVINVNSVRREAPEFDKHVRTLLSMRGIRLNSVRPQRDCSAHVSEGLPNVREATTLVA